MIIVNFLFLILFYLSIYIIAHNNDGAFCCVVKQSIEFIFYFCIGIFSGIMSLNATWLNVDFESVDHGEYASSDTVLYTIILALFGIVFVSYIIWIFSSFYYFPIYELVKFYKNINGENTPKISYSLFKNMFLLHPDYFKFKCPNYDEDYRTLLAIYYHDERISFRFIDYLFMLDFIRRYVEEGKYKNNKKKESKIYKLMQDDLEKDRIKAKENTEKALKEIKDASKKSIEIMNRII